MTPDGPGPRPPPGPTPPPDAPFAIRLARSGEVVPVAAGTTILEALRRHGLPVRGSCESGTCGACRTRYLAGEVEHRDLVLTEAQRRREVLICVSRAVSPELVLDL